MYSQSRQPMQFSSPVSCRRSKRARPKRSDRRASPRIVHGDGLAEEVEEGDPHGAANGANEVAQVLPEALAKLSRQPPSPRQATTTAVTMSRMSVAGRRSFHETARIWSRGSGRSSAYPRQEQEDGHGLEEEPQWPEPRRPGRPRAQEEQGPRKEVAITCAYSPSWMRANFMPSTPRGSPHQLGLRLQDIERHPVLGGEVATM